MSFHEVQFPTDLSYGSAGGPGHNTNVIVTDSGMEERVQRWETAKRQYDVRYAVKSKEQLAALKNFYIARSGSAFGFRFKDWLDYTTASDDRSSPSNVDHSIGTGDGTTTQFRLLKRYISGPTTKIRYLTKPVTGSVTVAKDGVNQSSGWTVDTTTGLITFSVAPANAVNVTAGCEFDVPVRFGKENDELLSLSIEDFGWGSSTPVMLVEIPDGLTVNEDANCGGAVEVCLNANYQVSPGYARAYVFWTNAAGLVTFLPDTATTPTGLFGWLINKGPNSLTVKTFGGGSTLTTINSGNMVAVFLTLDGVGAKVWYVG